MHKEYNIRVSKYKIMAKIKIECLVCTVVACLWFDIRVRPNVCFRV